jgi:hypothetical protein
VRPPVLALIVGLLTLSASGTANLILGEPCAAFELTRQGDDGACPPTCVTCGCCAQAVEPVVFATPSSPDDPVAATVAVLPDLPTADPRDILHVPRPVLA